MVNEKRTFDKIAENGDNMCSVPISALYRIHTNGSIDKQFKLIYVPAERLARYLAEKFGLDLDKESDVR